MDIFSVPISRDASDPVFGTDRGDHASDAPSAPADQHWREHGWSLGGIAVAALVGAVLVASCAWPLLG